MRPSPTEIVNRLNDLTSKFKNYGNGLFLGHGNESPADAVGKVVEQLEEFVDEMSQRLCTGYTGQ